MRYTFEFDVKETEGDVYLDLGRVGQNAELYVNGEYCGIRISRPYLFRVTDAVNSGKNTAVAIVSNTLVQKSRDTFSTYLQLSPSGLLGGVCVKYSK